MDPESRRMFAGEYEDADCKPIRSSNTLMGDHVERRREFIETTTWRSPTSTW